MAELISTMAQVPLTNGCTVTWEAIDPTDGSPVSGVIVRDATLYGYRLDGNSDAGPTEEAVPLWLPLPNVADGAVNA